MSQFRWAPVAVSLAQQLTAANESRLMLTIVTVLIIFRSREAIYDLTKPHVSFTNNLLKILLSVIFFK